MKKISLAHKWRGFSGRIFLIWLKRYKLLFFFVFVAVALWGGYEWQRNLFTYSWSPEDRQNYLQATIKETAFQETAFLKALEKLEAVASRHTHSVVPERELFVGPRPEEGTHAQ